MLVAGCGGQSQTGTSDPTGSGSGNGPSKSGFLKEADKICLHADRRQIELRGVYLGKHPSGEKTTAGQAALVRETTLPPMSEELAELRALKLPAAGGEEVESMLSEMESGMKEAEADPKGIVEGQWPLGGVEKRLKNFGFTECARPG